MNADGLYSANLQMFIGELKKVGVTANPVSYEYAKWIAEIYRPPFNWDGICWAAYGRGYYPDPDVYATYWLTPGGITNQSRVNDPEMTALVDKQRIQLNPKERWDTLHQIQMLEAKNVYYAWKGTISNTMFNQNRVHDLVAHPAYGAHEYWYIWVDA